jgi:hypothetical protein
VLVIWIDVGEVPLRVMMVPDAVMAAAVSGASAEFPPFRQFIAVPRSLISPVALCKYEYELANPTSPA